jgi:hypothetical protein
MTTKAHEIYKSLTTKALLQVQKKIKNLYDYEYLSGEGIKFYVNIDTKQMVPIKVGNLVTRLTEEVDEKGRHIVYIDNQKVLVPECEIICIGLN